MGVFIYIHKCILKYSRHFCVIPPVLESVVFICVIRKSARSYCPYILKLRTKSRPYAR